MKKEYETPKIEISAFLSDDPIALSGLNSLSASSTRTFSASDYDLKWSDKK